EQWKRPSEFLTTDKSPVVVDTDIGIQSFDLVKPNQHLHHSEVNFYGIVFFLIQ
ncbi:unnamed protein product, partial [Rotaria socialis]